MDSYFIDRTHKRLIRVDEFQHHGIMGQRWGVITRNVGVNYIPIGRRDSMLKNATTYNLDSWGKSPDKNVLYITGYSGSGKSSLAVAMQNESTSVINLDSYFEKAWGQSNNAVFNKFLDKTFPDYRKLSWPKDKISLTDWGKVCEQFEEQIEKFGRSEFTQGRHVICEGMQLLDDTIRPDKNFFRDKPFIIMNTNPVTSAYRSAKRDEIPFSLKQVGKDVKYYNIARKEINNLRKIFN